MKTKRIAKTKTATKTKATTKTQRGGAVKAAARPKMLDPTEEMSPPAPTATDSITKEEVLRRVALVIAANENLERRLRDTELQSFKRHAALQAQQRGINRLHKKIDRYRKEMDKIRREHFRPTPPPVPRPEMRPTPAPYARVVVRENGVETIREAHNHEELSDILSGMFV